MTSYLGDKKIYLGTLLGMMVLFCCPAKAYFDEGLGKTPEYADAVSGKTELTERDQQIMEKAAKMVLPKNKSFFDIGLGLGGSQLKNVTNGSQNASASVVNQTATTDNTKLKVGLGYRWQQLAISGDLLIHGKMHHYSSPMLTGGSTQIESDISTMAILFNGAFDLIQTQWVSPYVALGVGLASNTAKSTIKTLAGVEQSKGTGSSKSLAFKYAAGIKLRIKPLGGYLDFGYQVLDLGAVTIGPVDNTKLKSKDYTAKGLYVGYRYEF